MMKYDQIRICVYYDDFQRFSAISLWRNENNKLIILTPNGEREYSHSTYMLKDEDRICVERTSLQELVDNLYDQGIRPSQLGKVPWLVEYITKYITKEEPHYESV